MTIRDYANRRTAVLIVMICTAEAGRCDEVHGKVKPSELGILLDKQGYVAVPLLRSVNNNDDKAKVYLARVTINSKKLLLCIDTGAQYGVYLRLPALERVGINLVGIVADKASARSITETRTDVGLVDRVTFEGSPYVADGPVSVEYVGGMNTEESYANYKTGGTEVAALDGLIGLRFLQEHSAVIDCETSTMYLMPRAKRLLPQWGGRWECSGGERDGKPITDAATRWLWVRDDLTVEINAVGYSWRGALRPTRYGRRDLFHVFMTKPDGQSYAGIEGIYRLEGEKLTLCLHDNSLRDAPAARVQKNLPTEFSAGAGSGYVVYYFQRKSIKLPAEPPKK